MRSTVGPGNIIIRDKDKQAELEASGQTAVIDDLNRDPDRAYEITKDKHVEIEYYLSDTSIQKALEAGVAITEIMGSLLERISEPALAGAIRDHDIDPADALRQLQAQGCLEQHSQNLDIWQWIVPSAHAASCVITTLSGKPITITDREGCIEALIGAFYAETIGIVANRQQFEEGLMSGVKGQSQDFIDIFSDPAGMAKSLSNIAWEIAEDPVAAGLKYGFNTGDALSESSALYLKALANNDYVTAGEYMGRFAMDMAIALGTAEAGSAVEGAVFGAREAEALKAVEQVSTNRVGPSITEAGRPIEFDGKFYSADGFRFSSSYYDSLWSSGGASCTIFASKSDYG